MDGYIDYKNSFIIRHRDADWECHTSPMREDGSYYKTYVFSDGAMIYELNRPVYETAEAEAIVKGVKVRIKKEVKLMETEVWSTEDPKSMKFYELW